PCPRPCLGPGDPQPGCRDLRSAAAPLYCAMLARGPVYGADVLLRAFSEVHGRNPRARLAIYGPATAEIDVARFCGPAASAVSIFGELRRPAALAVIAASDV